MSSALQVRSGVRPAIVWLDSIEVGVEGVAGKRERRRQRTLASWRLERMTACWSNESMHGRAEAEEEKDDEEKRGERDLDVFPRVKLGLVVGGITGTATIAFF